MNRIRMILACLILMQGCAGSLPLDKAEGDAQQWLLDGSAWSAQLAGNLVLPEDDVMAMTPEMQSFAARWASTSGTERERLTGLLKAIVDPAELGVHYDSGATYTAAGTFRNRSANCLSFTLLTIALMRHAGLVGHFNEVDTPPIWDMRGNYTLEMYRHINVLGEMDGGKRFVVDLSMEEFDTSYEQRVITDQNAIAQYYNNRAMEFLTAAQQEEALRYEIRAIREQPRLYYLWGNLGSIYRRAGKLDAAEASFQRALALNSEDLVATSNLARLYTEMGKTDLAAKLAARAARFRERNPYYQYRLAMDAFLAKNYRSARDHAEQAINKYGREHRFHFLLGAAQEMLGERREAEISLKRALELSTDSDQIARYRSKWDRLKAAEPHG